MQLHTCLSLITYNFQCSQSSLSFFECHNHENVWDHTFHCDSQTLPSAWKDKWNKYICGMCKTVDQLIDVCSSSWWCLPQLCYIVTMSLLFSGFHFSRKWGTMKVVSSTEPYSLYYCQTYYRVIPCMLQWCIKESRGSRWKEIQGFDDFGLDFELVYFVVLLYCYVSREMLKKFWSPCGGYCRMIYLLCIVVTTVKI